MKRDDIAIRIKDFKGREIVWYKESYYEHLKKHPELKEIFDKVYKVLKNPTLIYKNRRRKSIDLYYECRTNKNGITMYLKLIADYNEKPAFIRSAHLTSNIDGASVYLGT